MWKKIEWNSSPTEFHPHSMICSVLLYPAKGFLLLKMKLEPKGDGGAIVAKDDTGKGGNWWPPCLSPAGQNPSDKGAEHRHLLWYPLLPCGATVRPGALATVGPSDPRNLPASLPWTPSLLPFVQGLGLCCPFSTHLHDVNALPQFWKDLCSLEEQIFKAKRFCCDEQKHKQ